MTRENGMAQQDDVRSLGRTSKVLSCLFFALLLMGIAPASRADSDDDIAVVHLQLIDTSRPTQPAFDFPGAPSRRLDTLVWYPKAHGRPLPLIIYSHGTYGAPDNAMHIVKNLVRHGYIVAAPAFPLTSRAAYTHLPAAFPTDVKNQPADVSFIIDQLLANKDLAPLIDPHAIGSTGHSLGAITSYFLSFGEKTRDPRIVANALLAGGDPVNANVKFHFGFDESSVVKDHTPVLFLSADKDVFSNFAGEKYAAYGRVGTPKYELMIHNGVHIYFRDVRDVEVRTDGKNPDCNFFEKNMAGTVIPGCEAPDTFIAAERQQKIARDALLMFFDAYLKHDKTARAHLRRLNKTYPETELKAQE